MAKLLCLALCLALVAGASAHWEINWPVYPVTGAADVITPISGSTGPGLKKVDPIVCPAGWRRENKDSEVVMGRKLIDAYFAKIGRPALLKQGNTQYGCPRGASYADGDPFLAPKTLLLGASKHNDVTVCVPTYVAPGKPYVILAQGVINYFCNDTPFWPLSVGIFGAKGTVTPTAGGVVPEPPVTVGPSVQAVGGTSLPGATKVPTISCPAGFRRDKKDSEVMLGRKVVDAVFSQIGRFQLLSQGNVKYGCPAGANFVDGDPFFPAVWKSGSKHNGVTVCVPINPVKGKANYVYASGVINYYCKDKKSTKLSVGVVNGLATYYP